MKAIKHVALSMLFATCFAACSNNDVVPALGEDETTDEVKTYGANVTLVLPSVKTSRAAEEPEFDAGTEQEYYIGSDVHFEFFDANKNRMGIVSGQNITWTNGTEGGKDNITRQGTVTLQANRKPAYMIVFVNANNTIYTSINSMSLEELNKPQHNAGNGNKEEIKDLFANTTNGFLMVNSSYIDKAGHTIKETPVSDYIYEVGSEGSKEPVTVYLERVVAKTSVTVSADSKGNTEDGNKYYEISNPEGSATKGKYGVKFMGWSLNATNCSTIPLKQISNWGTKYSYFSSVAWNSSANGRSYWAEDGNYTSAGNYLTNDGFIGQQIKEDIKPLELNYYSINQITNKFGDVEYCLENTSEADLYDRYGTVTHILIKGKYVTADGKEVNENVYRIGKTVYTETELKEYVINTLKNEFPTSADKLDTKDIKINYSKLNWNGQADVKQTIVQYTGTAEIGTVNKDNLNQHMFGGSTVWVYYNGLCYYSLPIKHFSNLNKTQTGYYGVVRNHWYQIDVTGIQGFGHPADPDKPLVPEGNEDVEYALQANINILSWAKKAQAGSVGGDDVWN